VDIKWIAVYIAEAHAYDEWPLASARYNKGEVVHVPQTKSLAQRSAAATEFFENFGYNSELSTPWELVVAPPLDLDPSLSGLAKFGFEDLYCPWPFRMYGLIGNQFDFLPEPHACELRIDELTDWLTKNTRRHTDH